MASLQQKGNGWYCQFLYLGKRHTFAVGQVTKDEAESKAQQVDYLLMRLKQRLAVVPTGVDIVEYIQFDGRVVPPQDPTVEKIALKKLREQYITTNEKSLEPSTVECIRIHFRHLEKLLGPDFCVSDVQLADLQGYVDKRAKAKGLNGRKVSAQTIQKELQTLRTAWGWGVRMKLVAGPFPNEGLRFPKIAEKPPFMTRAEIERRIAAGGLTKAEEAELWDTLYLTTDEIAEFLKYVKAHGAQPWVYPMLCFAAYTGARRSEIIRVRIADIDLDGLTVLINERKRVKGKLTTRRVPLSPVLLAILKEWLDDHPGGQYLFCQKLIVDRSKTRSRTTGHKGSKTRPKSAAGRAAGVTNRKSVASGPLTTDEANDHLRRALADSKWDVVRGWHALRHSFVSACASKGIDQRLVQAWAGHMSADISRRYSHLYPSTQQEAWRKCSDEALNGDPKCPRINCRFRVRQIGDGELMIQLDSSRLRLWFDRFEKVLTDQAETAGVLEHGGMIGTAREFFIKAVLRSFLPPIVHIGSGKIFDASGGSSKQVDIVLFDGRFPVLEFEEGVGLYPVEGVLATIEVKSTLSTDRLRSSLENSLSVLRLGPIGESTAPLDERARYLMGAESRPRHEAIRVVGYEVMIPTYVFAFNGIKKETIASSTDAWFQNSGTLPVPEMPVLAKNDRSGESFGITPDPIVTREFHPGEDVMAKARAEYGENAEVFFATWDTRQRFGFFASHILMTICNRIGMERNGLRYTIKQHMPWDDYFEQHLRGTDAMYLTWNPMNRKPLNPWGIDQK